MQYSVIRFYLKASVGYQSGVDGGKWCKWWLILRVFIELATETIILRADAGS